MDYTTSINLFRISEGLSSIFSMCFRVHAYLVATIFSLKVHKGWFQLLTSHTSNSEEKKHKFSKNAVYINWAKEADSKPNNHIPRSKEKQTLYI